MKARPYPKWISLTFIAAMAGLAFTGLLQMPLAKWYYLTDVPGMAWTGDLLFVHKLHYVIAMLLLFVLGLTVMNWWLAWKDRLVLTRLGLLRVILLAGLVISGGLRVFRNLPGVTLDPVAIVTIEWSHMLLAVAMGVIALVALVRKSSAYALRR